MMKELRTGKVTKVSAENFHDMLLRIKIEEVFEHGRKAMRDVLENGQENIYSLGTMYNLMLK